MRLFLTETAFAQACARGVEAGFLISCASMNCRLARQYYQACITGDMAAVAMHREQQEKVLIAMRNCRDFQGRIVRATRNPTEAQRSSGKLLLRRALRRLCGAAPNSAPRRMRGFADVID
jgi:hypothetical protein